MPGKNYKFDENKLLYTSDKPGFKERFNNFVKFFSISFLSALIFVIAFFSIYGLPSEKYLIRKNSGLISKYNALKDVFSEFDSTLAEIQLKDDSLYRIILEKQPLSPEIRQGGFGGTDKYKPLENLENADLVISEAKRLDIISKKADVQLNSYNEVLKAAKEKEKFHKAFPALSPLPEEKIGYISDYFGPRMHPIHNEELFHWGVDLTADIGTEIHAPGDGVVEELNYHSVGYGKTLLIDHGFGFKTLYAHLSGYNVKAGDTVKRGDVIAFVGNAGTSSGPHLHYEIIKDGKKINPFNYFTIDMDSIEYLSIISR
ncbi:MAG: M23 family metallopeptidase [Prolixibacteraceae bacterium]|nr:M23 family metallopeptidase [Prolixibacteraceae bacterium]